MSWPRGSCYTPPSPRFVGDSLLEEAGFEPSVPRDTTKFSMPAHVTYAWFPARGKVGANENRHHEDARAPPAEPMVRILFPPPASLWAGLRGAS